MKGYTIQDTQFKCDFLTRPSQNSKQIASVPPTNNNNNKYVRLNLTSWQFGWKVRNVHIFTTTYNHLTKYHTWYIYKPDWYIVVLFLAIMWRFNDCHLWLVMFLRRAIHWGVPLALNVSSSQYQINKLDIGNISSSWWPQYGILILRSELQLSLFPLPLHLIIDRLTIRHWYRIYHCD